MQAGSLGGVIEADETFFRSSYKGSRGWKRGAAPENRPPRYRGGTALLPGLSSEQVPVLTALDRTGGVVETVLPACTDSAIAAALDRRIAPGSVLCSDGMKGYVKAAVAAGGEHRCILPPRKGWLVKVIDGNAVDPVPEGTGQLGWPVGGGKPRRPGRLGLGHVNAHHERLKTFINREARGVSTRYLPIYLGWLRASRTPGFDPVALVGNALSTTK